MSYLTVLSFIICCCCLSAVSCELPLMDSFNYYVNPSAYNSQVYIKLQESFSMKNIMDISLDIAMETCENSFKWDRWNCPNSDFIQRLASQPLFLDAEDSYINAITTAAILYTITKNCSTGTIAECNTSSDSPYNTQSSDNPKAAEKLLKKHVHLEFDDDFFGNISKHNYHAITNLFEKSLVEQCDCEIRGANGTCIKEVCLQVLKPFKDIAADIRQMYEESLQLTNNEQNTHILWDNIPLDALVYMKDSPNYCEPDAVPHWNGMRHRQCSPTSNANATNLTKEDYTRCRHLCHECGYTIQSRKIITEIPCNCKFTWTFRVQCETCVTAQKQYYCY